VKRYHLTLREQAYLFHSEYKFSVAVSCSI
jgi:hypothetical protein